MHLDTRGSTRDDFSQLAGVFPTKNATSMWIVCTPSAHRDRTVSETMNRSLCNVTSRSLGTCVACGLILSQFWSNFNSIARNKVPRVIMREGDEGERGSLCERDWSRRDNWWCLKRINLYVVKNYFIPPIVRDRFDSIGFSLAHVYTSAYIYVSASRDFTERFGDS